MHIRDFISRIQCKRFHIPYKEGIFIHPLSSLQVEGKLLIEGTVSFQNNTFLGVKPKATVVIGNGAFFNAGARIDSINSINIGKNVIVGPNVYISDFNHEYVNPLIPIKEQHLVSRGGVAIGEDTWIGVNSVVVGKISIGRHCIIGAGSIVTHDIPDYSVAVGNPARVIKQYNFRDNKWEKV